ncbi:MAG TPA: ArsI/CadI family heavy metal resistance metalloenzyme [Tepidisphaeraceae bacterium]|jgi:catechol 2,3-dioxygenase-like lactoylglutathione lyase family enzyme|nr:ArsI/CadI family heavy metal resistance metalloenzyme [Tepidisphaeraceae bacterium]
MTATIEPVTPSKPASVSAPTMFHISLNVADLEKAIAFYRVLLGVAPAKCYPDYAKFELADPPLVLSLEPSPHTGGGALNHLGFRVANAPALIAMQQRLEAAGIATNREDGVECCYARQTKFWVKDVDRNLWELYVLEADTDHRGAGSATLREEHAAAKEHARTQPPSAKPEVAWEHQLGQPIPANLPLASNSADRILLKGTLNVPLAGDEKLQLMREARRSLRQGGKIIIHGLAADAPLNGEIPTLPGPAAGVQYVPSEAELSELLLSNGFHALRLAKLSPTPFFRHGTIGLREILLEAVKLEATPFDLKQVVLYQGPLSEVRDDFGNVFHRGRRITLSTPAVEALRGGSMADSFIFFPPGGER